MATFGVCKTNQAKIKQRSLNFKTSYRVIWPISTSGEWSWSTVWNPGLLRKSRFLKKLLTTSRACLQNLCKTWSLKFKNARTSARWIFSKWFLTVSHLSLAKKPTTCNKLFTSTISNFYSSHEGCSGRGSKQGERKSPKFLKFSILSTTQNLNRKSQTSSLRWAL